MAATGGGRSTNGSNGSGGGAPSSAGAVAGPSDGASGSASGGTAGGGGGGTAGGGGDASGAGSGEAARGTRGRRRWAVWAVGPRRRVGVGRGRRAPADGGAAAASGGATGAGSAGASGGGATGAGAGGGGAAGGAAAADKACPRTLHPTAVAAAPTLKVVGNSMKPAPKARALLCLRKNLDVFLGVTALPLCIKAGLWAFVSSLDLGAEYHRPTLALCIEAGQSCFVSGHDFSRAVKGPRRDWALAPALFSLPGSCNNRANGQQYRRVLL